MKNRPCLFGRTNNNAWPSTVSNEIHQNGQKSRIEKTIAFTITRELIKKYNPLKTSNFSTITCSVYKTSLQDSELYF